MERARHETVATALVAPWVLAELEVHLMGLDLRVWPIATAPNCADPPRRAFQVRRRMLDSHRGAWDEAAAWPAVWISFGPSLCQPGEPVPYPARKVLYDVLDEYRPAVRYRRGLTGVPPLRVLPERAA